MEMLAYALTGLVVLFHISVVVIETVLFDQVGTRVFRLSPEKAAIVKPAMSNQGCYNCFLVAALALGLLWPEPAIAHAFLIYGLACVVVAGIWGGVTVGKRITILQSIPAALALLAFWAAH
jgi:putative membrane protein